MRSLATPVILATLLAGFASAAPAAYDTTSAAAPVATAYDTTSAAAPVATTASFSKHNIILVSTVLSCGSATSSVAAAATSIPAAIETPASWTPTANDQKACDEASFAEESVDDPVTPADWNACASLYSTWASYNGTFTIGRKNATSGDGDGTGYDYPAKRAYDAPGTNIDYIPILQADSCTFAVKPNSLDQLLAMGDVDISLILKKALNEYSSGSLLGARGSVNCAVRGNDKSVKAALGWQIYYPGA